MAEEFAKVSFINLVYSGKIKTQNTDGTTTEKYPEGHDPAPPFKGQKIYKSGAKKGELKPLYKAYIKQNKDKNNFKAGNELGGLVISGKKGTFLDSEKVRDNRRMDFKVKASLGAEMSNGVLRPKPNSRKSFDINVVDDPVDGKTVALKEIRDYLKGKKGKFFIKWDGGHFELDLIGSWKKGDRVVFEAGFLVGSDSSYFVEENKVSGRTNWKVEVLEFNNIKFKPLKGTQIYADNNKGTCIIDPIINYYKKRDSKYAQDATRKLEKRAEKCPNGLSPDEIQKLCNTYKIGVEIYDIFNHNILNCRPKSENPKKVFKYVNTRENHAESWNYCEFFDKDRDIEEFETAEEMRQKYDELEKNGEEFTFKTSKRIQGKDKISYINTKTIHYQIEDPLGCLEQDFYNQYPIPYLEDEIEYDDEGKNIHRGVGKFINSATYVNGIHDFNIYDKEEEIVEHDVNKAYATFKECKYYEHYKFPKVPTDFRNVSGQDIDLIINKTGWTQVRNIEGEGNAFELANLQEYGVYPNCELRCLKDLGVKFDIVVSAWSTENFEFEFNDELLETLEHPDHKKEKPYAIIVGKMLGYNVKQTTYYKYVNKPSDSFVNEMSYYNPDMRKVWDNEDEKFMIIEKDKQTVKHRNHVGSYITAYVRCRMYEEIEKYKREDLWFVRSDAIKHKGNYPLPDGFKEVRDNIKLHEYNTEDDTYESFMNTKEIIYDWDFGSFKDYENIIKYMGAGGTGKTYSFIHDKGLCYKAIAFPTNELKEDFEFKHKFTHHAVGGLVCGRDPKGQIKRANTRDFDKKAIGNLFIDEITMRNSQDVNDLLKVKCPRKIFAGDWDEDTGMVYQLKPVKEEFPYQLLQPYQSVYFTKNYRVKDPELLQIINKIRSLMKKNFEKITLQSLNNYIVDKYLNNKLIPENDIYEKYNIDDLCICSLNVNQKRINEEFDKKGVKSTEDNLMKFTQNMTKKWKITAKTDEYPNGKFVRGDIKTKCKELAFATTIHAVQGKTWKNKLFIDTDNMFEWGMLYTAVSRLTKLDDLYLLGD